MPSLYYKRRLPHWQPAESSFFITFRLADSIPMEVLRRMRENYEMIRMGIISQSDLTEKERRELIYAEQKRLFVKQDAYLDKNPNGPYWLREDKIASVVAAEFHRHDGKWYTLHSYCIMPNHVHVSLTLLKGAPTLAKILQNIKLYSALKCNRALGRNGQFWARESYDHIIRNEEEFDRILHYILQNPVKAGFVKHWKGWRWTYWAGEIEIASNAVQEHCQPLYNRNKPTNIQREEDWGGLNKPNRILKEIPSKRIILKQRFR